MSEHTADLYNVNEEDRVTITTTEGETFIGECKLNQNSRPDERTGEIYQTNIWTFNTPHGKIVTSIIEGLRSSEDDPTFPLHKKLWNKHTGESMGYIESIKIHGKHFGE